MRDARCEIFSDYPKLQHPHLAEFCNIDMEMVDVTLGQSSLFRLELSLKYIAGWVKFLFPEFELSWLGVCPCSFLLPVLADII